jgi:integrase
MNYMKNRFRIIKNRSRGGIYYLVNKETEQRDSLETTNKERANELLTASNEAHREPAFNLQKARIYLNASDPEISTRTWQEGLNAAIESKPKDSANRHRWETAAKDEALNGLRTKVIIETTPGDLLTALLEGTVSTNVFLRRLHNFCIDMNWLPWPILAKKKWPAVKHKKKRAITEEEHQKIVAREENPERKKFYELCWELGGSQTDIANLWGEDVAWDDRTLCYDRQKLASLESTDIKPPLIRFGKKCEAILRSLPATGAFFPYLSSVDCKDRATEFKQRCQGLKINGVTLHSYRYAWAERARKAGYPRRYAEEALGHNSKAVHAAYASKAQVVVPSLEEYEEAMLKKKIMPVEFRSTEAPQTPEAKTA